MQSIVGLNGDVQEYLKLVKLMQESVLSRDYPTLVEALGFEFHNAENTLVCYDGEIKGGLVYDFDHSSAVVMAILSLQKGVGRALMSALEDSVLPECSQIELAANSNNFQFYEKLGYKIKEIDEPEFIMSKTIL